MDITFSGSMCLRKLGSQWLGTEVLELVIFVQVSRGSGALGVGTLCRGVSAERRCVPLLGVSRLICHNFPP